MTFPSHPKAWSAAAEPARPGRTRPLPRRVPAVGATLLLMLTAHVPTASANNVGENAAWQFQTSADKVNQAALQDMIQKRKSGYYAAPTYTTNIGRQYNCNVTATAQGNSGSNSAIANSPSTSGASADSVGNENWTDSDGGGGNVGTGQSNGGSVGSSVHGSTNTHVDGTATQALNSTQSNTGNQSAAVDGSSACAFGALN
jgi:hypothetical protein